MTRGDPQHPDSVPAHGTDAGDTRTRLLDTAERLFAEHGIESTSLRRITREANANLAAVHYHFGSKEALLEAVFSRRIGPLNHERLRLLDWAEAEAEVPSVESILHAFIAPTLQLISGSGQESRTLVRLIGRVHLEASETVRTMVFSQFQPLVGRFVQAFRRSLPGLPLPELICRLRFTVGAMAFTMAHLPPLESDPQLVEPELSPGFGIPLPEAGDLVRSLVAFLAAGMRSTPPSIEEDRP